MDKFTYNRNENLKKYETLYVKICSKQVHDYMRCLENSYDKLNYCEQLRNVYLSCINDKKYIDKMSELNLK